MPGVDSLQGAIEFLAKTPTADLWLDPAFQADRKRAVEVVSADLPEQIRVATRTGFLMEVHPRWDYVTSRAFLLDGVYEAATHAFIQQNLSPGDIYVDVGANIGTHVLPASRYVGPKGAVIAIEPNPEMVRRLKVNLDLNACSNVGIESIAVSDTRGKLRLFVHPLHAGNGFLVTEEEATPTYISALENSYRVNPEAGMLPLPGLGYKVSDGQSYALIQHDVVVSLLEDIVPATDYARVAMMKVDVEGAEMNVLRGAAALWRQPNPPCAIVEYEERYEGARAELYDFFVNRGWQVFILSVNDTGILTYNRLSEPFVASQFENLFAVPPSRLDRALSGCTVFDYDHAAMRAQYG